MRESAIPENIAELMLFVAGVGNLGHEIAFWRSHARRERLEQAADSLNSLLRNPEYFEGFGDRTPEALAAYEELLQKLTDLQQAVPFRNRVGVLRRSLVPVFQQIFVLRNLVLAIVCRLRQQSAMVPRAPAGSLMDRDYKSAMRGAVRAVAPSWDKEHWNVYDYL